MIIVNIKGTPDIKRVAFILDSKLRGEGGGTCAPVAHPPGSSALKFYDFIELFYIQNE